MADYVATIALDNSAFVGGLRQLQAPLANVLRGIQQMQSALNGLLGSQRQQASGGARVASSAQAATSATQAATSATRRNTDARRQNAQAAKKQAVSFDTMASAAVSLGGMLAVQAGAQALAGAGMEQQGRSLQTIGGMSIAGMSAGIPLGPWGMAGGAVAGGGAGVVADIFSRRGAEAKTEKDVQRQLAAVQVAESAAMRGMESATDPSALIARTETIRETMLKLQEQMQRGVIDEPNDIRVAEAKLGSLQRQLKVIEAIEASVRRRSNMTANEAAFAERSEKARIGAIAEMDLDSVRSKIAQIEQRMAAAGYRESAPSEVERDFTTLDALRARKTSIAEGRADAQTEAPSRSPLEFLRRMGQAGLDMGTDALGRVGVAGAGSPVDSIERHTAETVKELKIANQHFARGSGTTREAAVFS